MLSVVNASWTGRWPVLLAGLSGCLLLASVPSSPTTGLPLFAVIGHGREFHGTEWALAFAPILAIGLSLYLLRWWPYLIAAGGLAAGWALLAPDGGGYILRLCLQVVPQATVLIGVLAGAQSLLRRGAPGLGAVLAGLALGARLFGASWFASIVTYYDDQASGHEYWRHGLVLAGLAGTLAALTRARRADPAAAAPADGTRWSRVRLPLAGTLTMSLSVPLSYLSTSDVAALMGVDEYTLVRHPYAEVAMIGAVGLVLAAGLAALAGLWSLGAAVAVTIVQAAVVAPMGLALYALQYAGPARWIGTLAGVAIGVTAVVSRWRVAAAGVLTVAAATALFIAYAATTGRPERLAEQHRVVPSLVILVLAVAAGTAVVAAAATPLAKRGSVPVVLGPLAGVMTVAALQTLEATYVESDGLPTSSVLNTQSHMNTSAVLLLVAGATVGGLGVAHYLTERWAERKRAEQIRKEAAAAERDRLARPIHDGVLQVLAMVQRQDGGSPLATLAGEQEAALRRLLAGGGTLVPDARAGDRTDLRAALTELAGPGVEVAAPAEAVPLAEAKAGELVAAVRAALENVRRHAGDQARAWILLEDEGDGVRVSVRDDGPGIPDGRLVEAERDGRLGVAQSMRGRITDLNGTMTIDSRPGQGTEVEFWLPR